MTSAAAVLMYRPSPSGFAGTGESAKLTLGSSCAAASGFGAGVDASAAFGAACPDILRVCVGIGVCVGIANRLEAAGLVPVIRREGRAGCEDAFGWRKPRSAVLSGVWAGRASPLTVASTSRGLGATAKVVLEAGRGRKDQGTAARCMCDTARHRDMSAESKQPAASLRLAMDYGWVLRPRRLGDSEVHQERVFSR